MRDAALHPAGVQSPQLADGSFEHRRDLVWATRWPVRAIDQAGETTGLVVRDPRVDALTRDPVTFANLGDGEAITSDLEHCGISLFDHAELHEHCPGLLLVDAQKKRAAGRGCQASAEVTSRISPSPRQASAEVIRSSHYRMKTELSRDGGI